jgi:coenzyme F420-0:L-glutamate ligase / coenzyme F420-1:gamma-L-glutamate ligase
VLQLFGVPGLPEIVSGANLASLIVTAAAAAGKPLADDDIVVVTSKIVSKAEGRQVVLADVEASPFARQFAEKWDKDPAVVELVLREAKRVIRQVGPVLITETHHGFCCANSGVDVSSSGGHGIAVVLPVDSDASARSIRAGIAAACGRTVAVIVSDTFGRPWREGQTDVAIGIAGMHPLTSYIGQVDPHGHEFRVQLLATADELAGAAELVKGNVSRVPVAVVRGFAFERDETVTIAPLLRDASLDLFR